MKDVVGSRWTRVHGGWYFLGYDNTDVEAIALNDEGYLLADTVTPDGYYVNKRGVLEIDGREVTHCEECIYIASSIDVPDQDDVFCYVVSADDLFRKCISVRADSDVTDQCMCGWYSDISSCTGE